MDPVCVHLAVLAITGPAAAANAAMENIVADRATAAGHQITAFTAVRDSEVAIRAQLVGWIEDPDVDLVIVIGEGSAVSKALEPLVVQKLPGFADLLRMLAFQELGSAAMLSNAEAARCGSTFVFVLPASAGVVTAAMDKLILPQLDPRTEPHNLIESMPRLADHDLTKVDSVPTVIAPEKTAVGSGMPAKLPAKIRDRPRTGANVIARKVEDPTKPIELAKLEQQIELSKPADVTKPMDLGRRTLPRLPPGADAAALRESDDTKETAAAPPPPAAARAVRTQPPPALARIQLRPLPDRLPPVRETPRPANLADPRAEPPELLIVDEAPPAVALHPLPTLPGPAAAHPRDQESSAPAAPAVESSAPPAASSAAAAAAASAAAASSAASSLSGATSDAPAAASSAPAAASAAAAVVPGVELEASPVASSVPAIPLSDADLVPVPAPVRVRPPTEPPPLPRTTARPKTAPPDDLPPLPGSSELPRGKFVYPTQRRRSKIPLVIGLLVLAAGTGAGAMLLLNHDRGAAPPAKPVAVTLPIEQPATPDAVEIAPDVPDVGPDIEIDPTPDAQVVTADASMTTPTNRRPPRPPRNPPTGSNTGSRPPPVTPDPPPAGDPDCEEVACVLEKYARPCCARYKPAGESFKPIVGTLDSLDKRQIRAGVEAVKPKVIACGEQFKVKGTVKLAMTIDSEGAVQEVAVRTTPDAALGQCVAAALRIARFAKTREGGSFTYPFVF